MAFVLAAVYVLVSIASGLVLFAMAFTGFVPSQEFVATSAFTALLLAAGARLRDLLDDN